MRHTTTSIAGSLLALALTACASGEPPASSEAHNPQAPQSTVHPAHWPRVPRPVIDDEALDERLQKLLGELSIEEKVGQIIQADIRTATPDDVRRYRLGAVLSGGDSGPGGNDLAPAHEWLAAADAFYRASMDTSGGGHAIPIFWGIDAVHGHNNIVGATLFPHNIALGATRNVELIERIGETTARAVRVTGQDWTFAPAVSVARDVRWGRAYESYSEDPALVSEYARAMVRGLQGTAGSAGFLRGERVIATAKHFIGDGGTSLGRDQGDAQIDEAELRAVHAPGYVAAIGAGVQVVMASFSSWQGRKVHGHRGLLTEVLKERMGFDGFVLGDWNAHGQLEGCSNTSCAIAFNAGIDMFMAAEDWQALYTNTLAQVRAGEIPMERLDDAVRRILRVKLRAGLFEAGAPSSRPLAGRFDLLGSPEHRALARRAVRESLVLLKNSGRILPIRADAHVLVAGDGADNIAKQSGGWTLSWQGASLGNEHFPNADSILQGIRAAVTAGGGRVSFDREGRYRSRPDVAVVVFGEEPYAEFHGDVDTLAYQSDDERDLALLRKLAAERIPVVAVFLSGRPLSVTQEIEAADAFVAAWLPGSEGAGIADVLIARPDGSVNHDFKGKLPFSWPRAPLQTAAESPLFHSGYGLTYSGNSK